MKKLGILVLGATFLASAGWGESLTLEQAVDAALARGPDQAILAAGLASSRAVNAQAQARVGLTVTPSVGYNASETWNDPGRAQVTTGASADPKVSTVGTATYDGAVPQNLQAGVTVATPLTSLAVKGTEAFQPSPTGDLNHLSSASAGVTQVLWNGYPGGPAQAAADKAALALRVAELNAQASRNRLVLTVKQAFYTLLSTQESMAQLVQTRDSRKDALRFVQARYDLKQATGLDLKAAQINLQSAELDLQSGQSALDVARRRLANLMGRGDQAFSAAVAPDPKVPATTLDDAVALALKNRVDPQIAQANAASAQVDATSAWGAALPTVNLSGGLTYTKDWQRNTAAYLGTVGVSVGVPLVDAGAAAGLAAQAAAQKVSAQTQYEQLLRSIPVDVAEAWSAWQVSQQRYDVAGASVDVAQGQRQVVQAQFDAGLKTITDLQTADIAVTTAQFALLKAKITAQLAALQLQNLLGL